MIISVPFCPIVNILPEAMGALDPGCKMLKELVQYVLMSIFSPSVSLNGKRIVGFGNSPFITGPIVSLSKDDISSSEIAVVFIPAWTSCASSILLSNSGEMGLFSSSLIALLIFSCSNVYSHS